MGFLGSSEYPRQLREATGHPLITLHRPVMHHRIINFARELGVTIRFGHKLETLEQNDEEVTVTFANGVKETFSFVVGCDGLHSKTRVCLFGDMPADYTGVTHVRPCACSFTVILLTAFGPQCAGMSPTPEFWKGKRSPADIYGDGVSRIVLPMGDDFTAWAYVHTDLKWTTY